MLLNILKSLFNFICNSAAPKPPQQPIQQEHYYGQQPQHFTPSRPQKHGDLNQRNQENRYYTGLRSRANQEGDQMAKAFEQSHQAYSQGDKARAKKLSDQGKDHQQKMESLNRQASEWIFCENNKDSQPGEVDLHGLYVKEAIEYTDRAIQEAKQKGNTELHLIVGKGLHSKGGSAKIKPAIEELMERHQLFARLDPQNAGVLIVQIDSGGNGGVNPDEITHRLEQGCIVM